MPILPFMPKGGRELMNTAKKSIENRKSKRYSLTGSLPGAMFEPESNTIIQCKPVDVSQNGLGVMTWSQFDPGSSLILRGNNVDIKFTVIWSISCHEEHNVWRCGLEAEDKDSDLVSLFNERGCFDDGA